MVSSNAATGVAVDAELARTAGGAAGVSVTIGVDISGKSDGGNGVPSRAAAACAVWGWLVNVAAEGRMLTDQLS
jgi:hypothetical protein